MNDDVIDYDETKGDCEIQKLIDAAAEQPLVASVCVEMYWANIFNIDDIPILCILSL